MRFINKKKIIMCSITLKAKYKYWHFVVAPSQNVTRIINI